ncbi:hypothetical protein [uncultured Shewanella sp.]|nr:hypothetical protein [uncultured Shewanella sp.]
MLSKGVFDFYYVVIKGRIIAEAKWEILATIYRDKQNKWWQGA